MGNLYPLIALFVLSQTVLNLVQRKFLKKTKYEYAFTVLYQLFSGLIAIPFIPFDHMKGNLSLELYLLFFLSLIFWALTNVFYLSSFKYEEASVLSPIFPLYNVVAYIISVLFFKSNIDLFTFLGFIFIIAASLLSGFYRTKFKPSKGVMLALASVVFEGIALALSINVTRNFSIPLYIAIGFTIPGLINLFLFLRPKRSEIKYEFKIQWKALLLCALLVDLLYLFQYAALRVGTTSQVISFGSASTFLIVIGGILFLGERKNISIKLFSALLATIGVILAQF